MGRSWNNIFFFINLRCIEFKTFAAVVAIWQHNVERTVAFNLFCNIAPFCKFLILENLKLYYAIKKYYD
ncbi:hypothetical protein T4B_3710 [Trichinella pseudospiralis]|uniref:Uncharacterized protein n=1 Tax=Trichinella pseudospiralis TaxID=6337 RepID=A0A0V1H6U7_TRIPS|nr:hypothetical protein T4B_3710 [Trichinella pseudospiralis]